MHQEKAQLWKLFVVFIFAKIEIKPKTRKYEEICICLLEKLARRMMFMLQDLIYTMLIK